MFGSDSKPITSILDGVDGISAKVCRAFIDELWGCDTGAAQQMSVPATMAEIQKLWSFSEEQ